MKTNGSLALAALLAGAALSTHGQALPAVETGPDGSRYRAGELIIQFRSDVTDQQITGAFQRGRLGLIKHIRTPAMEKHGRIGITREGFRATAQQYCAELGARMGDRAWLQLSDVMLIDETLRPVQGTAQRLLVARLSAAIITADGRVHDIERLVFDHMLARWGLTRAAVSRAILADRRQAA